MTTKKDKKGARKKSEAEATRSPVDDVRAAFDAGSYAGVRRLALTVPGELAPDEKRELDRLLATVALDPAQVAVGVFALVVVVIVALLTLHT